MIYFARHGHKAIGDYYNADLNILDDPLCEDGHSDAQRVAEYFRGIDISRIIVSEYLRTQQTAAPVSLEKRIEPVVDSRVNEINNGDLRYMSEDEAAAAYPDLWRDFSQHLQDVQFPGGESGEDVKKRQDSFLRDMQKVEGDVLVVSHDGYIRLLMCNLLGIPVYMRYKFKTDMGGISLIEFDKKDDQWKIIRFNQVV